MINVVTKSGTNSVRGSVSFFARDRKLQGLPATFDRTNSSLPFDRQQYSFALGAPISKDKLFAFGAFEYRNQDDAALVGIRNAANRTITNGFALAPLDHALFNSQVGYIANDENTFNFRYSFEDVKATDQSKLDRAHGSASYLQNLKNRFHSSQTALTSVLSPNAVNNFSFSVNILITRRIRPRRGFNSHFRAFSTVHRSVFRKAQSRNVCNLPILLI